MHQSTSSGGLGSFNQLSHTNRMAQGGFRPYRSYKGNLPTILVIPAPNFSAAFAKVGYLGLKNILENNEINYTIFTIFQES